MVQLFAGWSVFKLRHLGLGWAGALIGLLTIFGCYCAPSALVLAGYATWVLSRDDVRARFTVGALPASSGA